MIFNDNSQIKNVTGIEDEDRVAICNFLQKAVDCWCENCPDKWFATRDLVGRSQLLVWDDTPLVVLYNKHKHKAQKDAVRAAGIDSGWLLKKVIADDKRKFNTEIRGMVRKYKWDGDTSIKS